MTKITMAVLALGTALLAACSSSDTKSAPLDFNARADAYNEIAARSFGKPATDAAEMPVVGTGSYEGAAIVGTETGEQLAAHVGLNADFASGDVTSTLSSFQSSERGLLAGEATGTGRITGSAFSGTAIGQIGPEGQQRNLAATLNGNFVGATADGIVGSVDATLTDGDISSQFMGGFVTERADALLGVAAHGQIAQ